MDRVDEADDEEEEEQSGGDDDDDVVAIVEREWDALVTLSQGRLWLRILKLFCDDDSLDGKRLCQGLKHLVVEHSDLEL